MIDDPKYKEAKRPIPPLWKLIEKSLPLVDKKGNVWYVRFMYNRIERKILCDVRKFDKFETELQDRYTPTTMGCYGDVEFMSLIAGTIEKMKGRYEK